MHGGTVTAILNSIMYSAILQHNCPQQSLPTRQITLAVAALLFFMLLPTTTRAEVSPLPVEGGVITSRVGWRLDPFGSGKRLFHRGIDIAVPVGTPVRAVRAGRVVLAGEHGAYGVAVILEHDDASRTLYGHNALTRVQQGERVPAGAVIALTGNSGRSTGPHLHFEELPNTQDGGRPAQEPAIAVAAQPALEQRANHEQTIDNALRSLLNSITSPAYQPALTGQGG